MPNYLPRLRQCHSYQGLIGKITRVQTPEGQVKEYRYDPNTGFLNQEIVFTNTADYDANTADPNDPNAARVTTYVHDPVLGKVSSMNQTGIGTTYFGYDVMARVTYTRSPRGLETQRVYDGFGRLKELREREPGASNYTKVAENTYDAMSRITEQTRYDDPNDPTVGRTIRFAYDAMGRQTSREDPNGTTTHMTYDPAGRVTRQYVTTTSSPTSTCLSDTTFEYDELGRLWRQRDRKTPGADDNSNDRIVRTYRYRDGKVQRVENGADNTTNVVRYAYDSAGRVIRTELPGDTVIEPNYYANGQTCIQKTTYADGTVQKIEHVRNSMGQIEQTKVYYDPNLPRDANAPAYEASNFTYTSTGQVRTRTDARGIVTYYEYDAQGHVVRSYENCQGALQREIRYEYDPNNGNFSRYVGVNGTQEQTTGYEYDCRGNVKTITYPNGDAINMTYDRAGRLLTREVVGGTTVSYEYNANGMLTKRTGTIDASTTCEDSYDYDALGRMITAIRKLNDTEVSKVEFTYDGLGRLATEKLTIDEATKTITYPLYDQSDRRLRMSLPEGEEFNYTYTTAGQVDQILRGTAALVDYDYVGPAVQRRRVYSALDPNIHVDWLAYRDGLLRLRESANSRTHPGDPNYAVSWASYQYARQATGLPTSETFSLFCDPNGTLRQYEHDELARLERVIYGSDPNRSPQERFVMDLAGNRIKYIGRHGEEPNYYIDPNGANQYTLIEPGACEPNYDRAGNLVIDHRGYNYKYDHDNKLIKVTRTGMHTVDFEYDALGRRVKKTDWSLSLGTSCRTYYLSSGQNEVVEYDGLGRRLRYYVHGPTYIDERVVMHNDPVAGGAATTGSDYIYLLKDLYTVAGMADERGWPVERYDYDAYGKVYMERVRVLPWAADFDGDGDVDSDDLAVLHGAYKGSGQEPNGPRGWRADLDGDGDVDGSDYALFADAYRGSGIALGGGLSLRSASMAVSRIGNPYFFTARRLDVIDIQNAGTPHHFTDDYAGLQLYDYRARTYDPVVGRFLEADPLAYRDGMSLYGYVRGQPLFMVDPSGLAGRACCKVSREFPTVNPVMMKKRQFEIDKGTKSAYEACRCALQFSSEHLDSATDGPCCWCTVSVMKMAGPGPVIPILNWWAHEKVTISCANGKGCEAEVWPRFPQKDRAGPATLVVGDLSPTSGFGYWTEQSTMLDCDCAGNYADYLRALNGTTVWYDTYTNNCCNYAQRWYDAMKSGCYGQ